MLVLDVIQLLRADAMRRQYPQNLVRTTSGGLSLSQNLGIPCPGQLEA